MPALWAAGQRAVACELVLAVLQAAAVDGGRTMTALQWTAYLFFGFPIAVACALAGMFLALAWIGFLYRLILAAGQ